MFSDSAGEISHNYSLAFNVLMLVIPFLDVEDLGACAQVCQLWKEVILQCTIWTKYTLRMCPNHLSGPPERLVPLVRKLELSEILREQWSKVSELLENAAEVAELTLRDIEFNWLDKIRNIWSNLEVLRVSQSPYPRTNQTFEFYLRCTNLTALNLITHSAILIDDLKTLKNLKSLYVDADYRRGFFQPHHKFLRNLHHFGVGFAQYRSSSIKQLYINKLPVLFKTVLTDINELKLSGLDTDFLILHAVSRLPKLKRLELELIRLSDDFRFFLVQCKNIEKLSVQLMWGELKELKEFTAHSSFLVFTVKQLKQLTELDWICDFNYMSPNRRMSGELYNLSKYEKFAICRNICNLSNVDSEGEYRLKNFTEAAQNYPIHRLPLCELELILAKQVPHVKVRALANKYSTNCNYCEFMDLTMLTNRLKPLRRWFRRRGLPVIRIPL